MDINKIGRFLKSVIADLDWSIVMAILAAVALIVDGVLDGIPFLLCLLVGAILGLVVWLLIQGLTSIVKQVRYSYWYHELKRKWRDA